VNPGRSRFFLYWSVVGLFVLILGWWLVFFSRLGTVLVERADQAGAELTPAQMAAVRDAAAVSTRMLIFEGSFLVLLLLAGVLLIVRSMRQEVVLARQRQDFLSAVTHELKTPITSARLHVESLILGRVPEPKKAGYLEIACAELDRLDEMVNHLLDTARTSSGRAELQLERLDLAAFTTNMTARLEKSELAGAQVEVHAPDEVQVDADPSALETILRNLFTNALKYGGESPRIRVSVSNGAGEARLEVRDFGPGLKDGKPERLFAPFTRSGDEMVRERPGVGLGLYLVAELTRALGGQVSARNVADGGGFAVQVALPLASGGGA
jgi:signal transduction histidine kinase